MQGMRSSKQMEKELWIYTWGINRAAIEVIISYSLSLASGLVVVLEQYFAPSITIGVVSVGFWWLNT